MCDSNLQFRRLDRQFRLIEQWAPLMRRPLVTLRASRWRALRIPLASALILGGVFSFMPLLGFWMLPLGLLLLAIDLPFLRAPVTTVIIRTRRRFRIWLYHRRKCS